MLKKTHESNSSAVPIIWLDICCLLLASSRHWYCIFKNLLWREYFFTNNPRYLGIVCLLLFKWRSMKTLLIIISLFIRNFLSREIFKVKNALKTKFRSWKISHISTQFFQLHRNQSQTYTTQTLTSNYNVATQRNRIEVNGPDPTCLPMLPEQEDKL